MKVILNSNTSWSVHNFRMELVELLIRQRIEVVIVAPFDNSVGHLIEIGVKYVNIEFDKKGTSFFKDLKYAFALLKIFRKENPDLILNYTIKPNIWGGICCTILKTKYISIITGFGSSMIGEYLLLKIISILYRIALRRSMKILFLNEFDRSYFISNKICHLQKTFVLPGEGVDTDKYNIENKTWFPNEKIRFGYIGRIIKDKGIYEFIDAARFWNAINPNFEFYLMGAVDEDNPSAISDVELQQWCSEGFIKHYDKTNNVLSYLKMIDCLILPSFREGLSRIILEALSCRIPVLASDVPGCNELVLENITGFLFKSKDSQSLINSITKFSSISVVERIKLGEAGRRLVKSKYNINLVINIYSELINLCVGSKHK